MSEYRDSAVDVDAPTRQRVRVTTWRLGLIVMALSVVIHVLPVGLYLTQIVLSSWLGWSQDQAPAPDHPTIIPIELDLEEAPEQPSTPTTAPPVQALEEAPSAVAKPSPDSLDGGATDSGIADAAPDAAEADARAEATDAGPGDAAPKDAGPEDATVPDADVPDVRERGPDAAIASARPDASPDAAVAAAATDAGLGRDAAVASADAGFAPIHDPVGLAGNARRIAPQNPNVSLILYLDRIRQTSLGRQFAPTLTNLQQWEDFFRDTGLDPVQDVDRMLLAGPQLRDSSRLVVIMQYNAPRPQVRAAVEQIVDRSGTRGQWLDAGVPAAKIFADRAERYVVMPSPKLLVVVPTDGLEQALQLPPTTNIARPKNPDAAMVLYLRHPKNAFRNLPVRIPETIEWMRVSLTIAPDEGVYLNIDAKDRDAESAQQHAGEMTQEVDRISVIDAIFTKKRVLDTTTFHADGDHIRATTHIKQGQLKTILSMIAAKIDQLKAEQEAKRR